MYTISMQTTTHQINVCPNGEVPSETLPLPCRVQHDPMSMLHHSTQGLLENLSIWQPHNQRFLCIIYLKKALP